MANEYVGQPLDRVDGRLKVTGGARYAAEFSAPGLLHGVLVQSTVAKGKITRIDTSLAERAPGVVKVITYENMPPVAQPASPPAGQNNHLLEPEIRYSGQNVAVVVAETLEQAEHAAELVVVEYDAGPPEIGLEENLGHAFVPTNSGRRVSSKRGDFDAGIASAQTKVDQIYRTPYEHHNPMEPHATVAIWTGDKLVAYDATQGVVGSAANIARVLGVAPENVQVIDPFVGGGFGCKGQSWPHSPISAMAAKAIGRPVKIMLSRRQMFWSNGHRPATRQAQVLGASPDGKLVALQHQSVNDDSELNMFIEPTGAVIGHLYSCSNVDIGQKLVRLNIPAATYQRAPGEATGSFCIETAMDELAWELGADPVELRLRNYAETDEESKRPYTSKSLRECYQQAAERFGWSKRNPTIGSMRDGRWLVGYGMATASYPANFGAATARARMYANGNVLIQIATQDLGTGTYTILTQIAADGMGVDPANVRVEIADSHLPRAPGSGGSTSATTCGSAVKLATAALLAEIVGMTAQDATSPLVGLNSAEVQAQNGIVTSKKDPSKRTTFREILSRAGKASVEKEATTQPPPRNPPPGAPGGPGHTGQGFGAQFCEVRVDPELRMIRVARWTGAFAVGTILNAKTLVSQLRGGIVFGIGMGLLEESVMDSRYGRYVNSNLAEYHVPVNADVPDVDVILVPEKDELVSPIGAKGAGEIGITGAAAAIGNAVYHATGKRVRDLPITLDKIL
jgi:xanthine dehydrogenase YagR molybdenum-binding subunit